MFSNAGAEIEKMLNDRVSDFAAHDMLAGNYMLITVSDSPNLPELPRGCIVIAKNNGPAVTDASYYIAYVLDEPVAGHIDTVYDCKPRRDLCILPKSLEEWAGGSVWCGKRGELHEFATSMLEIGRYGLDKIEIHVMKPIRTKPIEARIAVEIIHSTYHGHPELDSYSLRGGRLYGNCEEKVKADEIASSPWLQHQLKAYNHLQKLMFRRHAATKSVFCFDPAGFIESPTSPCGDLLSLYACFEAPLHAYRHVPTPKLKAGMNRVNGTVCKRKRKRKCQ